MSRVRRWIRRFCLSDTLLPDLEEWWQRTLYFVLAYHVIVLVMALVALMAVGWLLGLFARVTHAPFWLVAPFSVTLSVAMLVWIVGALVEGVRWCIRGPEARDE